MIIRNISARDNGAVMGNKRGEKNIIRRKMSFWLKNREKEEAPAQIEVCQKTFCLVCG
jgi:hypothetical protein